MHHAVEIFDRLLLPVAVFPPVCKLLSTVVDYHCDQRAYVKACFELFLYRNIPWRQEPGCADTSFCIGSLLSAAAAHDGFIASSTGTGSWMGRSFSPRPSALLTSGQMSLYDC